MRSLMMGTAFVMVLPMGSLAEIIHFPDKDLFFNCCQEPDGLGGGLTFVDVDVDANGSTEFTFEADRFTDFDFSDTQYAVSGGNGRMVVDGSDAAVLERDATIDTSASFSLSGDLYSVISDFGFVDLLGPWADVRDKYLGFEFDIDGNQHFGWMRISTMGGNLIHEWAYNASPGTPITGGQIIIPEPTSMLLIAGCVAVAVFWRAIVS